MDDSEANDRDLTVKSTNERTVSFALPPRRGERLVMNRRRTAVIMSVYFASGACSLIDEVVWVRLLRLSLGNTVHASSIVVSVFLGGLALGALFSARFADRLRRPLLTYALLELGVTISALSVPFLLRLGDRAYRTYFSAHGPDTGGLLPMQVLVSAVVLLVPTMLMGGTLPILGRYVTRRADLIGRSVGLLYALNTLGAAVGCFLAGFVLIRALGVMGTLYAAAGVNLAVAAMAAGCSGRGAAPVMPQKPVVREGVAGDRPEIKRARHRWLLLGGCFVGGAVGVAYELLWMRSIISFVGATTYVFSAVLTVFLLGSMMGAAIASGIAGTRARATSVFATVLWLSGLMGIAYVPILSLGPFLHSRVVEPLVAALRQWPGLSRQVTYPALISLSFFLLPSVVLGMGFPLILRAWRPGVKGDGEATGEIYGVNTVGAVVGGLGAGFVLIPCLGVQQSMSFLGIAAALMASVLFMVFGGRARFTGSAVLAVTVIAAFSVPQDLFERCFFDKLRAQYRATELAHLAEGSTTTVSVHREADDSLHLSASGMHIASDQYGQSAWQKFHGYSGFLLHTNASSALCIGFGSGETAACLASAVPGQVDCVEISPEVVGAARKFFRHIGITEKEADSLNVIIMDGKNYVRLSDKKYDLILNDPINPLLADNAALYTSDFFGDVREDLQPGGRFLCWLPVRLPKSAFDSIIGTALDAFAHVTLWSVPVSGDDFVQLVCSVEDQRFIPAHIDNEIASQPRGQGLARVGVPSSVEFLALYRGDERDIRQYLREYKVNSDMHPVVEFSSARIPGRDEARLRTGVLFGSARRFSLFEHVEWSGMTPGEKAKWRESMRLVAGELL